MLAKRGRIAELRSIVRNGKSLGMYSIPVAIDSARLKCKGHLCSVNQIEIHPLRREAHVTASEFINDYDLKDVFARLQVCAQTQRTTSLYLSHVCLACGV